MSYETSGASNIKCIKPWDTNKTLKATFKFIKDNQNTPSGSFYQTTLYLGISILESQDFNNYNNRKQAFNIINGKIIKVRDSYLVIETASPCFEEVQEYTVAYSDIANVRCEVFSIYFNEYMAYMNNLPSVCNTCGNRYYEMIQALQSKISENNPFVSLYLIYGGNFSLQYSESDFNIVKNLVIVQKNGLIPITYITGFFTVPRLLEATKEVKDEEIDSLNKGGMLNESN